MVKAGVVLVVCFLSVAALAAAEKPSDTGTVMGLFSRRVLGDESYEIVECKPQHKDCPNGSYCVYYPDKKCKTEKECKPEKVQKCVKYSVYYETTDPYGTYQENFHQKDVKCIEHGYEEREKCYDKEVCFEYICAKLAPGYH